VQSRVSACYGRYSTQQATQRVYQNNSGRCVDESPALIRGLCVTSSNLVTNLTDDVRQLRTCCSYEALRNVFLMFAIMESTGVIYDVTTGAT